MFYFSINKYAFQIGLLTLVALSVCGDLAYAQASTDQNRYASVGQKFPLNIAAQPLVSALAKLKEQSGVTVDVAGDLLHGKVSGEVKGQLDAQEALNILLAPTGLIAAPLPVNAGQAKQQGSSARHFVIRAAYVDGVAPVASTSVAPLQSSPTEQQSSKQASVLPDARTLSTIAVVAQHEREHLTKEQALQAPLSSNILTRDEIELFRGTSVGDIFKGTAGVLVGENRNSGGLDVNIRGMQGQGRVPVIVDGAQQETTVYRGYAGVSSRSYIDPDLIGSTQIDKGPIAGVEGAGATGGVVSMRTIGVDDIVRAGQTFGIRVRGQLISNNTGRPLEVGTPSGFPAAKSSFHPSETAGRPFRIDCVGDQTHCEGEFNIKHALGPVEGMDRPAWYKPKSWAGSVSVAKRFENLDLVAAYAKRQQGNYYAGTKGPVGKLNISKQDKEAWYTTIYPYIEGATRFRGGERIVNTHFESKSLLLKSNYFISDESNVELSFMRYNSNYGQLMPSQLLWFGQAKQTDTSAVRVDSYVAKYRWNPESSPYLDIKTNFWHTNANSETLNYFDETPGKINGPTSEQYKRWGVDVSNTTLIDRWGKIKLDYGFSLQKEHIATRAESSGAIYDSRNGKRNQTSIFAAMNWQFTPKWKLEAGLRHLRFNSRDGLLRRVYSSSAYCKNPPEITMPNQIVECDSVHIENAKSATTPILSLSWEPISGVAMYGRYAQATRMPSLFESTQGFSVSPELDIDLKPERSKNKEVGISYLKNNLLLKDDKFQFKTAIFHNYTKDYLTRTVPNKWEEGSGPNGTFFTMRNINGVKIRGFELSGSYDAGLAFAEVSGTKYNFIEVCHDGSNRRQACNSYGIEASYINNMIPPNWHASAMIGTRLLNKKLTVGAKGTFMGRRNAVPQYNDSGVGTGLFVKPVPWHRYTTWDLFASYKINEQFKVDFNIDNITDQYYLDALSLGLVPAPGRSARLSVIWQF